MEQINELLQDIESIVGEIDGLFADDSELKNGLVESIQKLGFDVNENTSIGDLLLIIEELNLVPNDVMTATDSDCLKGKIFTDSDGIVHTGTMEDLSPSTDTTITPGTEDIILPKGYYSKGITIPGLYCYPKHVVKGVTLFGIEGEGLIPR